MNKRYRLFLLFNVLYIMFVAVSVNAEAPVYDLPTEFVMEFPWMAGGYSYLVFMDGNVYISGDKTYRIDPIKKTIYEYDINNEISTIIGEKDNRLIIYREKPETRAKYTDENGFIDLYFYDPASESYEKIDKIKGGTVGTYVMKLFYYYNNTYLAYRRNEESYRYVSIDALTGKEIFKGSAISGISPDKMHAFINYPDIRNLQTGKKVGEFKSANNLYFITNDLFFADNLGHIDVCDLTGKVKVAFNYMIPTGLPENADCEAMSFKKVKNSEYGVSSYFYQNMRHLILVKTPNEMEYLDSLGLLFHPTTATLNDDRVRMREWPLLDAQHVDFLEQDEEVEVLDRSGIKVQIGDMHDYWYKIKRSDGTEGWSYGHFLDLAVEE